MAGCDPDRCPGDINGSFLYTLPGRGGAPFTPWDAGEYRIDVLAGDDIERIDVRIPDPVRRRAAARRSPVVADCDGQRRRQLHLGRGTRAIRDRRRHGLHLEALPDRPLTEGEAWQDLALFDGAHVASVALPRASGLGVMLQPSALLDAASIARLSPGDDAFSAPDPTEDATEHPPRSRYAVFSPADDGVWAPGVYAISVDWPTPPGRTTAHGTSSCDPLLPGVG